MRANTEKIVKGSYIPVDVIALGVALAEELNKMAEEKFNITITVDSDSAVRVDMRVSTAHFETTMRLLGNGEWQTDEPSYIIPYH